MLTAKETRGGKSRRAPPSRVDREWRRGGGASPRSRGRDLIGLLADALDRLAVAKARHLSELAVRRLDPVAVEHLVGRDVARGDVERRGARRARAGVDEDGAALGAVEVAARALGLLEVAGEGAAVALDEVALVLVVLELLARLLDPVAVLVADPGEGVHGAVLLRHPGEELVVHVEGRDARDGHLAPVEGLARELGALLLALLEGRRAERLEGLALGLGDEGLLGGGDGRVGGHFVVCCV